MATQPIDYALMAGASNISTRTDINRFPIPVGWTVMTNPDSHFSDPATGFKRLLFRRHRHRHLLCRHLREDITGDIFADVDSQQLGQLNSCKPNITSRSRLKIPMRRASLSLGWFRRRLAALMGVFFGQRAITFDQAPLPGQQS
jgi:hypothetical protein